MTKFKGETSECGKNPQNCKECPTRKDHPNRPCCGVHCVECQRKCDAHLHEEPEFDPYDLSAG